MKKSILTWLFPGLVLLVSLTLSVGILFAGPSQAGANERLSQPPELLDSDGQLNMDFLGDVAAWVNDHFFGRQELISVSNWLSAKVFGTSGKADVILGREGWLYYAPTLDNYAGQNQMTAREIFSAAKNLSLMAKVCESQGRDFAFMIAPNKNSLYPEGMPDYGVTALERDAQRLHKALDALGVPYIDLYALFGAEEAPLYFAHDSHWNSKGAALAADAINAAFGVESSYGQDAFAASESHTGDLYEMLYPAFSDPETNPVYGGALTFTYETSATRPDSLRLKTASQAAGSLLVYRDSFGNLLYPYLADSYGSALFSRSTSYDLTQPGDKVLIELVERNLGYLITYVPFMPAPQAEVALPAGVCGTISLTIEAKNAPEGTVLVRGTLPQACDTDSGIYVVCGETAYEAFCLAEGGFAAYVPEGAQAIVFTVGGEPLMYQINN